MLTTIKGSLLPKIPFKGRYITYEDLQKDLPNNWSGWDHKIKSLGAHVLKGLFNTCIGEYPLHPFQLKETKVKNEWLSNQFVLMELRLLS
jgi:hypothetical protein